MTIKSQLLLLILLVSWGSFSCRKDRKSGGEAESKPAIATLAKPSYTLGDSMVINLTQPLAQLTVTVDGSQAASMNRAGNTLLVGTTAQQVGLHQVVVSGVATNNEKVSDTLTVDLWSDIKPEQLQFSVLKTYPHQSTSFTQGLEFHNGALYESTGLNGQSKVMLVDVPSGSIVKSVPLADQYFGEGITIVNDRIYQLTWTSGQCFRYTMDFTLDKMFSYPTQGWGLTHRDTTLILSDGSNKLYFYTPNFQKTGEVVVYDDKGPVMKLNELEYLNGYVLANVWQTNRIVQIDPESGKVIGELIMDSIVPAGSDSTTNVLNGIAYYPQDKTLYVTGKNWPTLFKLQVKSLLKAKEKRIVALR